MPLQRLPDDRLEEEQAKLDEWRDPPIPVWAWLTLDGAELPGELHGWADNVRGAGGLWGLVTATREFAPGFQAEGVSWVRAEQLRERPT